MNPNRIFCIGRNYAEHIRELGHARDDEALIFLKPPSCIVPAGQPIRLPRGRGSVHHETEVVLQLTGGGTDLAPEDALRHVGAITLGLDLTLRELQARLKARGAPWELAKGFDDAAPLGRWIPYAGQDLAALEFFCEVNGTQRQHGDTKDMLFPVPRILSILSQTWALLPGDIVYTGTPAGVGPLHPGDRVVLHGPQLGRHEWTCA